MIAVEIGTTLMDYGREVKGLTVEQAQLGFVVSEEEVPDFLTFWLKQDSNSDMFVLYTRTR